jgi:hypothetical protein
MQGATVLAIALTGLGCQNKSCDLSNPPPPYRSFGDSYTYTNPYPHYTTPSYYSGYDSRSYADNAWDPYPTHWDSLRSTLWSLVLGRDPDVATAREIEASVYGDSAGH